MSDNLEIKLSGSDFLEAAKSQVSALERIQAAVSALDRMDLKRLNKTVQSAIQEVKAASLEGASAGTTLMNVMATSVEKAAPAAAAKAKAAGKKTGEAFKAGFEEVTGENNLSVKVSSGSVRLPGGFTATAPSGSLADIPNMTRQRSEFIAASGGTTAEMRRAVADASAQSARQLDARVAATRAADKSLAAEALATSNSAHATHLSQLDSQVSYAQKANRLVESDKAAGVKAATAQHNSQLDSRASYDLKAYTQAEAAKVSWAAVAAQQNGKQLDLRVAEELRTAKTLAAGAAATANSANAQHLSQLDSRVSFTQKAAKQLAADELSSGKASATERQYQSGLQYSYDQTAIKNLATSGKASATERQYQSGLQYSYDQKAIKDLAASGKASSVERQYQAGLEYNYNQSAIKKLAAEQAAAEAARNANIAKNAAFYSSSPQAQITRTNRVGYALRAGMDSDTATAKYGSAAVGESIALGTAAKTSGSAASKALAADEAKLTAATKELHSAARGAASGLNAMWLTWGSLAPMLVGAGISHAFVESIKKGAEFGQSLGIIQALGEQTTSQMSLLNKEILTLSKSGVSQGPLAMAGAMKALALAGLSAKEQIEALRPVLNFAVAGEVPLKEAAETLVAVSTAYGFEAKDFSVVSDMISKASAVSMVSVTDMSQAFKVASAVAQQFNVSLLDSATTLALLGQMGIKGSAAGTAMRQSYSELLGSSKKSRELLKNVLHVDAFDSQTNGMKPLIEVYAQVSDALDKLEPKSRQYAIQALGNERGTKAILANVLAYRTAIAAVPGETEGATNKLAKLQNQLADAPGFAATAAIAMSLTALNQMKAVGATLETVLVEAFQKIEPSVIMVSRTLREAFASPEFTASVSGMVTSIGTLITFLVDHASALVTLGKLYLVYQAATIGSALATGLAAAATGAYTTVTTAMAARTAAAALALEAVNLAMLSSAPAASTAAASLLLVNRAFGLLGLVVTAGAAAYYLFAKAKDTALTDSSALSKALASETIEQMDKETARLEKTMELRRTGLSEQELASSVTHLAARQAIVDNAAQLTAVQELALAETQLTRSRLIANKFSPSTKGPALAALDGQESEQRSAMAAANKAADDRLAEFDAASARNKAAAKLNAKEAYAAAQARRPASNPGGNKYDPDAKTGGALRDANEDYKNSKRAIELITSGNAMLADEVDHTAKRKEAILQESYDRGLTDARTYQKQLTQIQAEQATVRIALAESERDQVKRGLAVLTEKAAAQKRAGKPHVDDALQNDIYTETQKYVKSEQKVAYLVDDKQTALGKSQTSQIQPAIDMLKSEAKDKAVSAEQTREALEKLNIKGQGLALTEKEVFVQSAVLSALEAQTKEEVKRQAVIDSLVKDGAFDTRFTDPAVMAVYTAVQKLLDDAKALTAGDQLKIADAAGKKYDTKQQEEGVKKVNQELESGIKGSLEAALSGNFTGMKGFGEKMKKMVINSLVDAFYSAYVADAVKSLSRQIMSAFAPSPSAGGGGGFNWGGLVSGVAGIFAGSAGGANLVEGSLAGANAASAAGGDGLSSLLSSNSNFAGYSLPGKSDGGYTGDGGKYTPAGIVHAGEFVVNASATKKLGLGYLNELNGYAEGGFVSNGPAFSGTSPAAGSAVQTPPMVFAPVTHINVDSRTDRSAVMQDVHRVVAENTKQYTEQLKRIKVIPS